MHRRSRWIARVNILALARREMDRPTAARMSTVKVKSSCCRFFANTSRWCTEQCACLGSAHQLEFALSTDEHSAPRERATFAGESILRHCVMTFSLDLPRRRLGRLRVELNVSISPRPSARAREMNTLETSFYPYLHARAREDGCDFGVARVSAMGTRCEKAVSRDRQGCRFLGRSRRRIPRCEIVRAAGAVAVRRRTRATPRTSRNTRPRRRRRS